MLPKPIESVGVKLIFSCPLCGESNLSDIIPTDVGKHKLGGLLELCMILRYPAAGTKWFKVRICVKYVWLAVFRCWNDQYFLDVKEAMQYHTSQHVLIFST